MTDYIELQRLAEAIESCTSIPAEDEAAWMRRTTGRKVIEALEELENFKAEIPKWTEREIKLIAENEVARMRIKEMDLLFGRYILAMRAAVIEENAEKGMEWIYNSLAGPGELPPEDETDAQAYFDREIVAVDNGMQEVLAFHDARRAAKEKF